MERQKCRPFMFCFEKEGKLWFCTNNTKQVYKDMQANPYVELSVANSSSYAWIRLKGKAVFENNMDVKKRLYGKSYRKRSIQYSR